jgi:hypothetical protein
MKTFDEWDIDEVESTFGLRRVIEHHPALHAWLSVPHQPSLTAQDLLQTLQIELVEGVEEWNEDELKFKFIAPLISLIGFTTEYFRAFTQRPLRATVNGVELSGRVDFVVATGKAKPKQPFFFLHEYKKEFGSESNPRAQLLVEMLAARELNTIEYPLYGCYVVGRNWFFVVLEGNVYAESKQYAASDEDDLLHIFSILSEAKAVITRLAGQYA